MSAVLTPSPPTTAPKRETRPGTWLYWVFGALIALSLIAGVGIWIAGRVSEDREVKGFARYLAPGAADLLFKRNGQYVVYYEYKGKVDGETIDASRDVPANLTLELRDPNGQGLELRRLASENRYDAAGFQGIAVRRVRIPSPGTYHLAVDASASERFSVAVGRGDTPSTSSSEQAALLVGIIGAADWRHRDHHDRCAPQPFSRPRRGSPSRFGS